MCPSSDARRGAARDARSAPAIVVLSLVCCLVIPAPASLADDTTAPARAARTFLPDPLPTPDAYPSMPLVARDTSLTLLSQDRQRIAAQSIDTTGTRWRLDANLLFTKDSDVVRPAARARLAQIAASLASAQPSVVTITGYTDDLGSAEHGLDLSRRRARAVQRSLSSSLSRHGVTVTGRGEADPIVPNTSEANRARNRRVEVQVRAR